MDVLNICASRRISDFGHRISRTSVFSDISDISWTRTTPLSGLHIVTVYPIAHTRPDAGFPQTQSLLVLPYMPCVHKSAHSQPCDM